MKTQLRNYSSVQYSRHATLHSPNWRYHSEYNKPHRSTSGSGKLLRAYSIVLSRKLSFFKPSYPEDEIRIVDGIPRVQVNNSESQRLCCGQLHFLSVVVTTGQHACIIHVTAPLVGFQKWPSSLLAYGHAACGCFSSPFAWSATTSL